MMRQFTTSDTPGEIVKIFPKASDLFKENQIDFCCGGDRPLGEVFEEKQLSKDIILEQLNSEYETWKDAGNQPKDWDAVPASELIDHIVHTHHAHLMEELPALGQFVTKIYRVHGADQPHLKELYHLYNEFRVEMEEHSIKEETEVFPLIKKYETDPSPELLANIHEANGGLEDEHDAVGDILKRMREITNGFTPPVHACNSYRITYARLLELESETFKHIHLENNVLFKNLA